MIENILVSGKVNVIPTLRKFRDTASPRKFRGCQPRDIFRGVPVKKTPCISMYVVALRLTPRQCFAGRLHDSTELTYPTSQKKSSEVHKYHDGAGS